MQLVSTTSTAVQRDRLLPLSEVERLTGLKKSRIYQMEKQGHFPRRVRISARCVRWAESRCLQWVQDRIAAANSLDLQPSEASGQAHV